MASRLTLSRNGGPSAAVSLAAAREIDPDHHLWRNGRLYWVAFTVHLPPWQKERVRLSLGTADLAEARRRRDEVLRRYPEVRTCELSLRLDRRRRAGRRSLRRRSGTETRRAA